MAKPRVLVLRAPGTNCDQETVFAFESAGAEVSSIHVNQLIERSLVAENCQILCFPGGFSYGDDIAAGRILAARLQNHLQDVVDRFREEDRLMLGICNGFQVMMRMGIFFDSRTKPSATLTWNKQGRFEDRWVNLKVACPESPFFKGIDQMYLPIAHAEGRFVFASPTVHKEMESSGQLVLRYCDEQGHFGNGATEFPINPNGAESNIAGISDSTGRIFGLMPHPERHLFATHHPSWTRREVQPEHGDGFAVFKNAVDYFA